MTLENTNIYAVVGANLNDSEILSLHESASEALECAKRESEENEDWCLIKIERIV